MNGYAGSYVLVGFDGSAGSEHALRWGVEEARLRRLPVMVCHAWHWPYPVPPSGPVALETVRKMGQHTVDHGVFIAGETAPHVRVRRRLLAGPASAILVDESVNAVLTVVGSKGEGGFDGQAAGSTALQVASYAHSPVVLARSGEGGRTGPVLVGVDGSPASEAALGFAFEEAALRGRPLHAVYGCWEPEAVASAEMGMVSDPQELRETGRLRLERMVAPWREKYPLVQVETTLVMRTPRHALLDAADGAGLLVVGDRGLGGVEGLRLGSVSHAMLSHAPCSVAVVRSRI